MEPKIGEPWPARWGNRGWHAWRIGRDPCDAVPIEERRHRRREPRRMPWLARDGTVVPRAQKIQERGDDGGVEREGRRQLHQERPAFVGETVSLSQKRDQQVLYVLQPVFMCNRSRHFDGEPKIRRRTFPPLCVGSGGVGPIERRIDLGAAE